MNTSTKQSSNTAECGNKSKPPLVAGFPGTGKSEYIRLGEGSGYMPQGFATDSDSSKFDKSDFPRNYIEHIKEKISEGYARIFISSHKEVRDALVENGLEFTLVYPKKELKEEYLKRYKERGSPDGFINLISNNWNLWIDELENQKGCKHIQLESGQFIFTQNNF
jgi:hypothetical protein